MRCVPRIITIGHTFAHQNDYDLDPPYQRKSGIWTKVQRQRLIDSVIAGFDIPKLYLHVKPWHTDKKFAVADGKQRLTALWSFMSNDYPLSDSFSLIDHTDRPRGSPQPGAKYKDLSASWQDEITGRSLDFIEVHTPKDKDQAERLIRELFTRLNSGSALSPGEKARAKAGSLLDLARSINEHPFVTEHVTISTKRGQDMLLAMSFVAMEVEQHRNMTLICDRTAKRLEGLMTAEDTDSKLLAAEIEEGLMLRLDNLQGYFGKQDPLLKTRTLIDGFVCLIHWAENRKGGGGVNAADIHQFLTAFEKTRKADPNAYDGQAAVYNNLAGQGTSATQNLQDRVAILTRLFLEYERS